MSYSSDVGTFSTSFNIRVRVYISSLKHCWKISDSLRKNICLEWHQAKVFIVGGLYLRFRALKTIEITHVYIHGAQFTVNSFIFK